MGNQQASIPHLIELQPAALHLRQTQTLCPICRQADPYHWQYAESLQRVFNTLIVLLLTGGAEGTGAAKAHRLFHCKHQLISCGEIAEPWLQGGDVSGPSLL